MNLKFLNKRIVIKRKLTTEAGISKSGDIKKSAEETIASNVPMRITTNKTSDEKKLSEEGGWMNASYLSFTFTGIDIKINDYVEDDNERYLVAWVDKEPGGEIDSHYEIYMNNTRNE